MKFQVEAKVKIYKKWKIKTKTKIRFQVVILKNFLSSDLERT